MTPTSPKGRAEEIARKIHGEIHFDHPEEKRCLDLIAKALEEYAQEAADRASNAKFEAVILTAFKEGAASMRDRAAKVAGKLAVPHEGPCKPPLPSEVEEV